VQGGSREPTPGLRARPRAWYRTWWAATLLVVGFLVVLAVVLVVPVWTTDTPTYCSSCKATRAAGASWKESSHRRVSCVECHVPSGLGPALRWRAREWLNVWADYLDVPRNAQRGERPSSEACLACHDLADVPAQNGDVRMPHAVHVGLRDLACADCHDQVAHPATPGPGSAGAVSMAVCSMCHHEGGAPARCSLCHLSPPPADVHPAGYLETHGREALGDEEACLRCHHDRARFCDACHARPPADHFSGTWRYTHGSTAAADPLGCTGCHDRDVFCDQCHRVRHPADWKATHGAAAAGSGGGCLVCHPRSMCDRCHERRGVGVTP